MPGTINARQATPTASPVAATCDVAPRSVGEIQALAELVEEDNRPVSPLPAGVPADPATVAVVSAVLEEMGACLTAGDMLRFYALHSDDWLRRFAGQVEGLAIVSTGTPPLADGDRAVYLGPWHVQVLDDGRVMAAALLRVGNEVRPDPSRTRVLVFANQGGRWFVDETIARVQVEGCEGAVDVAAVVGPPPGVGVSLGGWSAACEELGVGGLRTVHDAPVSDIV
jgi:hypothetical protein